MTRFSVAAILAAFGVCGMSFAQSSKKTIDMYPSGVTFKGGVSLPLDSNLSDLGSTLIALGVEYTLNTPILKGGESYVALDYWTKNLSGKRGSVFPLTINQRVYTGLRDSGRRSYYFYGIGVAFLDVDKSDSVLAIRGGIGAELGDRLSFEAAGYLSDKARGAVRASAVVATIGYRF